MMRLLFAVVLGFIVWTLLWLAGNAAVSAVAPGALEMDAPPNPSALGALLLLAAAISWLSGYVAARVGGGRPRRAALVLGGVLLAVGVTIEAQYWRVLPLWYHIIFLALLLPLTYIGGRTVRPTL